MSTPGFLSERQLAGLLLVGCAAIFAVGGMLFTVRTIWKWPAAQTAGYLRLERSFVILAVLVTALGLVLLEDLLRAAGDPVIARTGMVAYLFGAFVVVVAETAYLHKREWIYPQIVFYVVVALLAQAAFGVALLRTGLLAGWVGWATIVWNLAWLAILPIASRRNMYFPALHHAAPLLIGIALLAP